MGYCHRTKMQLTLHTNVHLSTLSTIRLGDQRLKTNQTHHDITWPQEITRGRKRIEIYILCTILKLEVVVVADVIFSFLFFVDAYPFQTPECALEEREKTFLDYPFNVLSLAFFTCSTINIAYFRYRLFLPLYLIIRSRPDGCPIR